MIKFVYPDMTRLAVRWSSMHAWLIHGSSHHLAKVKLLCKRWNVDSLVFECFNVPFVLLSFEDKFLQILMSFICRFFFWRSGIGKDRENVQKSAKSEASDRRSRNTSEKSSELSKFTINEFDMSNAHAPVSLSGHLG